MKIQKTPNKKLKPKNKSKGAQDHALHLLRQMLLIRRFEEKAAELYTSLNIRGFLHLYIGEEAVAVGVMEALKQEDAVVATYREHGQALARGVAANTIMAEMYGKQEGCSRGRGGSMHLFDARTRFYGGNAIVGGGLPLAVGLALADKIQQKPQVTCCFFGEGAIAEGEFHETMNLAVLWQLPVLFLCENNLYAMGTALERSESKTNLIEKSKSYGVEAGSVDGMNVLAVEEAAKKAVRYVRSQQKPYFLECRTYRFRAHSMFDAELYRNKSEVEGWKKKDPISTFVELMKNKQLITAQDIKRIEKEVAQQVHEAVDFAEQGSWEPVEDLSRFVYSEQES
ncbi:pyruvate dehydrogenase E1 component alpha subunit [Catalinimonas alkaloidigena]|uniref:pyruvate dehydrogenase (acetyl-transferring) E1 component subunit alpha n=1 Tax=Catalinimonas alkaloidigena TaxID=1075417 RepID=UPI0024074EA5|nr:pyruvate dehydrogenase (acetyl-transferring) E1 component subunit alpha [Catalinimonas alkaloidigena]MDF9797860.1 pyruvate dehydrogenase E1 component alpha subunit [Catalinimonas alkaloidigena]